MSEINTNPLAKHFRQPALYIKLTSGGRYWKEGSLDLPVTGELPVYPMTTRDEITLRTPDALLNGTSVVNVIQSCCPNIKDAWKMPSIDVDSTLIAIRIASYGPKMAISSKCPNCGAEHDYDVDLAAVLGSITMPDYNKTISHDDLEIKLKPQSYEQVSQASVVMFEEEKLVELFANPDMDPEVRKLEYDKHLRKMIDLNIEAATNCTESITIQDGPAVSEPKYIKEFYANAESAVLRKVQESIEAIGSAVAIKPVAVKCTECSSTFDITVDFDYSSFFDRGF